MPNFDLTYIGRFVISIPSTKILPLLGFINPVKIWKQVVLPAPFGPNKPTASDLWTSIFILFRTSFFKNDFFLLPYLVL